MPVTQQDVTDWGAVTSTADHARRLRRPSSLTERSPRTLNCSAWANPDSTQVSTGKDGNAHSEDAPGFWCSLCCTLFGTREDAARNCRIVECWVREGEAVGSGER